MVDRLNLMLEGETQRLVLTWMHIVLAGILDDRSFGDAYAFPRTFALAFVDAGPKGVDDTVPSLDTARVQWHRDDYEESMRSGEKRHGHTAEA